MKRYHTKKVKYLKRASIGFGIFLLLFTLIDLIALRTIFPPIFVRITHEDFLLGRIISPLMRIVERTLWQVRDEDLVAGKVNLIINPNTWDEMNEGFKLRDGRPWVDGGILQIAGERYPVKIKGRGQSPTHFIGPKKSIWVIPDGRFKVNGWSRTSYNNFYHSNYSAELFVYDTAKMIGLIAPVHEFKHFYLNGNYQGLFHQIHDFDNSFLEIIGKPSSGVYYLDLLENPKDNFYSARYWRKRAWNKNLQKEEDKRLQEFLNCLNDECHNIEDFVKVDHYLKNKIIFDLMSSDHLDYRHNHRIYLDPKTGQFEPIMWDIILYYRSYHELAQSYNPIIRHFLSDAKTRQRYLDLMYTILSEDITEDYIDNYFKKLLETYKMDFLKDHYMGARESITFFEWSYHMQENARLIKEQRQKMLNMIDSFESLKIEKKDGEVQLTYNGPVNLEIKELSLSLISPWRKVREMVTFGEGDHVMERSDLVKDAFTYTLDNTRDSLKGLTIINPITKTEKYIQL